MSTSFMPTPHSDIAVSHSTLDQVLGFLAAKGFPADFNACKLLLFKCPTHIDMMHRFPDTLWSRVMWSRVLGKF